jgi:hypothetical protein
MGAGASAFSIQSMKADIEEQLQEAKRKFEVRRHSLHSPPVKQTPTATNKCPL